MTVINGVVPRGTKLTPTQQHALDGLLFAAELKVGPMIELRSPPLLGRGHGVTTVLRAVAAQLGAPLLGISTAMEKAGNETSPLMDLEPVRLVREAALQSLEKHGVAIFDDLDLASLTRNVQRSRTLVGEIKGAGQMWNWGLSTPPSLLLKTLCDAASQTGGIIIFSSVEDSGFQALLQEPFTVTMGEPTEADYSTVLCHRLDPKTAAAVDVKALFALHSQLAPAELLTSLARAMVKSRQQQKKQQKQQQCDLPSNEIALDTGALLDSVRDALVSTSAVSPEDVETVDLDKYPGLGEIKDELEKFVLFPLENPELSAQLGLSPKRGVLIHGEPGTGKTTVGRWLAHRLKGKFFRVGEMMVQSDIIKVFAAALAAAPSVVFIDDADIVIGGWRPIDGGRGSDIFRFLLGKMDGLTSRGERQHHNGDVIVILTAQNVQWMAKMLLRSGRIELWLKTSIPEPKAKREVLTKYISEDRGAMQLLGQDGNVPDVRPASQSGDRYCCADLRRIVSDAKVLAAWDQHNNPSGGKGEKRMDGAKYLEKAAKAVTDMHEEVDSISRALYA